MISSISSLSRHCALFITSAKTGSIPPEAEVIIPIVPVGAIVVVVAFLIGLPFVYMLCLKLGNPFQCKFWETLHI